MESETRFAMLQRSHPEAAQGFLEQAQKEAEQRFKMYQELASDRHSGVGRNPE